MSGTVKWIAGRTHPASPALDNREALLHDVNSQMQKSAFCQKDRTQSENIHKLQQSVRQRPPASQGLQLAS